MRFIKWLNNLNAARFRALLFVVAIVSISAANVLPGLRIRNYPNDSNPPDDAAYILDEITTNKHILHSQLRFRITNGLATITYVSNYVIAQSTNGATVAAGTGITIATNATTSNTTYTVASSVTTNGLATTNYVNDATNTLSSYVDKAASNRVTVAASTGITVATNGSGGVETYTVSSSVNTNGLATTNYVNDATNTLSAYVDKASSNRVSVAAGANTTVTPVGSGGVETFTIASFCTIQTNGVNVGVVTQINYIGATGQLSSSTAIIGGFSGGGGSGSLSGSTNFLNLSVQAAKLPTTNYVGIDAGWQDWETIYYETNAEGIRTNLTASWQFTVPPDYGTNSLKVRIQSLLLSTNGPNSSNTIFWVDFIRATSGDSTDLHTASFGTAFLGTNTWSASFNGTNKMQSLLMSTTTNCLLGAGDIAIMRVTRDAFDDTYGGATSLIGLQLEYTRP